MAILLIVALVAGYAWSVWLLWQQMHFELPYSPPPDRAESRHWKGHSRENPIVDRQHLRPSAIQTAHTSGRRV